MINITNAELWAFNVLNNTVNGAQAELQRAIASRDAYVKLLENKYNAEFDPKSGQFKSKGKEAKQVK